MSGAGGGLRIKRVYETPAPGDGFRVLVDRLWPRGLSKEKAGVDLWLKEVAPTTALRQWFHKNVERWPEFRKRYLAELAGNPALAALRSVVQEHTKRGCKGVTLLYAARSSDHNHALVLREKLRRGTTPRRAARPG